MNKKDFTGKTILDIVRMKSIGFDDEDCVKITFTDNSYVYIVAGYTYYTGNSID